MLEHRYRFHGHSSLRYVYRNGRIGRSRLLSVRFADNPAHNHSRVAIVVAKKVVKAAPKRNRIRRRLFETLRVNWQELIEHQDIVITVHSPEFLVMTSADLRHELQQLLASAHLLGPNRVSPDEKNPSS